MKNSKGYINVPIFKDRIVKNPNQNTLFPINWEETLDEDRYWYEEEEIFDELGNFIGMKKNLYVCFRDLVGCYRIKKNQSVNSKFKSIKLFETYSDKEEKNNE